MDLYRVRNTGHSFYEHWPSFQRDLSMKVAVAKAHPTIATKQSKRIVESKEFILQQPSFVRQDSCLIIDTVEQISVLIDKSKLLVCIEHFYNVVAIG